MQYKIDMKRIAKVQAIEWCYKLTFCIKAIHHSFLQIQLHREKKHSVTDNVLCMRTEYNDLDGTSLALAKHMTKASGLHLITI